MSKARIINAEVVFFLKPHSRKEGEMKSSAQDYFSMCVRRLQTTFFVNKLKKYGYKVSQSRTFSSCTIYVWRDGFWIWGRKYVLCLSIDLKCGREQFNFDPQVKNPQKFQRYLARAREKAEEAARAWHFIRPLTQKKEEEKAKAAKPVLIPETQPAPPTQTAVDH